MDYIKDYKVNSGFDTPEGCYIEEIFNNNNDPNCSIAMATVKPGKTTMLHRLQGVVERYVILQGEGTVEVDGEDSSLVNYLDVVFIPEGLSQRITNTSDVDLKFLCVCTPRFSEDCYESLT